MADDVFSTDYSEVRESIEHLDEHTSGSGNSDLVDLVKQDGKAVFRFAPLVKGGAKDVFYPSGLHWGFIPVEKGQKHGLPVGCAHYNHKEPCAICMGTAAAVMDGKIPQTVITAQGGPGVVGRYLVRVGLSDYEARKESSCGELPAVKIIKVPRSFFTWYKGKIESKNFGVHTFLDPETGKNIEFTRDAKASPVYSFEFLDPSPWTDIYGHPEGWPKAEKHVPVEHALDVVTKIREAEDSRHLETAFPILRSYFLKACEDVERILEEKDQGSEERSRRDLEAIIGGS